MKRTLSVISLLLVLLTCAASLVGCSKEAAEKNPVVGTWTNADDYVQTTLELTEDGKIILSATYMGKSYPFLEGTYTIDGSVMTIDDGESTETTEFSITDGVLSITVLGSDLTLRRK